MLINHPNEFKDGIRLIYAASRKKDGGKNRRRIDVVITYDVIEFDETIAWMYEDLEEGARIYASAVPRDYDKAEKAFKQRQLDLDYAPLGIRRDFYQHVSRAWKKCIGQSQDRSRQLFLFDVDSVYELDLYEACLKDGMVEEVHRYETKNGWHAITKPMNPGKLHASLSTKIHKDSMILWAWK